MKNKPLKRFLSTSMVMLYLTSTTIPTIAYTSRDLTKYVNVALGSLVEANDVEANQNYWTPNKVVDGIVNRNADKYEQSRWATNRDKAIGPKILTIDLKESKSFSSFVIEWERTNIKGFTIETSDDKTNWETVYTKNDDSNVKLTTNIDLGKEVEAKYVRLTVNNYDGGSVQSPWESVSIYEFKILDEVTSDNLSIYSTATANGQEIDKFSPDKVKDGIIDRDKASIEQSRWASSVGKGEKWIQLAWDEPQTIGTVVLEWERRNATKYNIQISDDGQTWTNIKSFTSSPKDKRQAIPLDKQEKAKYLRLSILEFDGSIDMNPGDSWENVSLFEFEVYEEIIKDEPEKEYTLDEVVNGITLPEIEKDQKKFVMPVVPKGFEIELIGADYEQIIDSDLTIYQPLVDTKVELNFKVSKGDESKETKAYEVNVPGKVTESIGNKKPVVIPEIAEWIGKEQGDFSITEESRIVVNPEYENELSFMATEFQKDYADITGNTPAIVYSKDSSSHDFYFTLGSTDKGLKEEGYRINIDDFVHVEAVDKQGAYWATRTILQILKQTGTTIAQGEARDYPKYELRGFMLDVARKPISREALNSIVKEMLWYKMNDLQMHLNDNAFPTEYQTEEGAMSSYSAFRLESDIKKDGNNGLNKQDLTSPDLFYTKEEFKNWIQDCRELGIDIVPEFDTPAHSLAFTKVRPDLRFGTRPAEVDHLNLHDKYDETFDFVTSIWDEYLEGNNPVFDKDTIINIGTDEYDATYTEEFRKYTDDMIKYIQESGHTVRLWGSLTQRSGSTPVKSENVQMNIWNTNWANPVEMYNKGYDLINMVDFKLYIVPGAEYYNDYLNTEYIYNTWEPNVMEGKTIPAGSEQMLGSAFALWNDKGDKLANGTSELDIYDRFISALPAVSSKIWGDGEDLNYQGMKEAASKLGEAPNDNPRFKEATKEGENNYLNYTFDDDKKMEDSSENNRDLKAENNVNFSENTMSLKGNDSYVITPIDKIGVGNTLSFDITMNKPAMPGEILFESDSEYGTHDIRILKDGTLGFTRELYEYSFGYKLPTNKKVNVSIATSKAKTTLFVDGIAYEAKGSYSYNGEIKKNNIKQSTFVMPIERIGSKTKAVNATIDNVILSNEEINYKPEVDPSNFEISASNQQVGNEIKKAFDNNVNTIWHSSWNPYVGLPATIVIDMKEAHTINKFVYLPRQDKNKNGKITKYSLYYKGKNEENVEWKPLKEHEILKDDDTEKVITFDSVDAQYIKFIAEEGTGDKQFAAAAEFKIYKGTSMKFEVSAYVEDEKMGKVYTNKQQVSSNEEVTFKVEENKGYKFIGWYNPITGDKVSDDKEYTTTVNSNTTLVAKFEALEVETIVSLDKTEATMTEGDSIQLQATSNKDSLDFTWESSNEKVATVDNEGKVTALKEGSAIITVKTEDGASANCNITVNKKEVIKIDKTELKKLLEEYKDYKQADYTEETWLVFKAEYDKAFEIYEREDASQDEVNNVIVELKDAESKLIKSEEVIKTDKSELKKLLEEYKDYKQDDYTKETWLEFKAAYDKAVKVYANEEATQEEVNNVIVELKEAESKLVKSEEVIKTDKTELKKLLEEYKEYKQNDYTKETWLIFKEAYDKALKVYDNEDATQAEVNNVIVELKDASSKLVKSEESIKVDKTKLEKLLEKYKKYKEDDYTKETWLVFKTAYDKAIKVYENEAASQKEIDNVIVELKDAKNKLIKSEKTDVSTPDKDKDKDKTNGDKGLVNTGDIASVGLWLLVLSLSGGMLIFISTKRVKRKS